MAGELFNVYRGGDKLKFPWENWVDADQSNPNGWNPYAGHIKRTNFTPLFWFDRYSDHWNKWFEESGFTDLEVGQGLGAMLLAAGSDVKQVVVHVKKPLPGTKIKVQVLGTAGNEPADMSALQAAIDKAKADYQKAVDALNAAPEDAAKKKAVTAAKKALNDAEAAMAEATKMLIQEHEVDFANAGFYRFKVDEFLQTNGKVDVILTEGTLDNACFSVLTEVNWFDDQHGCSCGVLPCDTEYPEPLCQPAHI